ncbi:hypothetical protein BaRGS_00011736 [Batillaria attramentaria]|uniref:SUN domain-containing protein n=1 Tax=Batillaria attramentaria TaxID=370345 RepID=A0ABD0LC90_9CAEN
MEGSERQEPPTGQTNMHDSSYCLTKVFSSCTLGKTDVKQPHVCLLSELHVSVAWLGGAPRSNVCRGGELCSQYFLQAVKSSLQPFTATHSCSAVGENAGRQNDPDAVVKSGQARTPGPDAEALPDRQQSGPLHGKDKVVNAQEDAGVGGLGPGASQAKSDRQSGNGVHLRDSGDVEVQQQKRQDGQNQKQANPDFVPDPQNIPSDTGAGPSKVDKQHVGSDGVSRLDGDHMNRDPAQVTTDSGADTDRSYDSTNGASAVPTVHVPGMSLQDAGRPVDDKTGEEHTALPGVDGVHLPSAPRFTSTSTTTFTASPTTAATTDSPLKKMADQIESPPTQAAPTPHQDSTQKESAEAVPANTPTKVETVTEQLLAESGGVMLEKTTVTTEEPRVEEDGEEAELKAEDFPSFGEWRQKVLEEQEKEEMENQKVKQMAGGNGEGEAQPTVAVSSQKLRVNYAAKVCGSKVVASNPEMENGNHMLTANKDEYMINPCSARKWFVVELSWNSFSSHPHSFRVALSDRYPTKEWVLAGTYDMTVDKVPQLFPLKVKSPYVKFVRVEMLDHYGNEHYCPVTLFRVFGFPIEDDDSEVEHSHHGEGEDEEQSEGNGESKTLFDRTKETVVNLVKKVLYKGDEVEESHDETKPPPDKPANVSTDGNGNHGNVPCDPDYMDDSKPAKPVEETPNGEKTESAAEVTVHQPQPTINTAPESSANAGPEEIPMVTKLDDGDQIEIEDGSWKRSSDQEMVRLLQSGSINAWGSALNFCRPRSHIGRQSCSYKPVCMYVEAMIGEPPPISFRHRDFDVTVSSTIAPSMMSTVSSTELDPSFPHSVTTVVKKVESSASVSSDVAESSLQPSSHAEVVQELQTSAMETAAIPADVFAGKTEPRAAGMHTEEAKKTSVNGGARQKSDPGDIENTGYKPDLQGSSDSSSDGIDTKSGKTSVPWTSEAHPNMATRPRSVRVESTSESKVVETDTAAAAATATTPTSTDDDVTASSSTDRSQSQEPSPDEVTEILEPSIHLESTSVISPSLTRPTPVLEVERASVDNGVAKPEVRETAVPCVSPTPTSVSADGEEGDVSQFAYPDIVAPTIEPSRKVEEPQTPSSELTSSTGTTTSLPQEPPTVNNASLAKDKNETEKKTEDLDLIHIPLSVNAKRETAIMRLTNRIKALELNVSLSSRFLEELSTRFKKQNEELMKMLNKTISRINATATASHRQNQEQELRIERLETRVDNLTLVVQQLADRFDTFAEQMTDRQMIATSVNFLLLLIAVTIWLRSCKPAPLHPDLQFLLDTMPRRPQLPSNLPRRNSDVTMSGSHNPDWGPAATLRKGGSAANLASVAVTDGRNVLLHDHPPSDDLRELGHKKKKRKKSKAFKASSMDLNSASALNGNNSQALEVQTTAGVLFGVGSEGRVSSGVIVDNVGGVIGGDSGRAERQFGHRRCGSASANITYPGESPVDLPPTESQNGVQFLLGGKVIPFPDEPPHAASTSASVPVCRCETTPSSFGANRTPYSQHSGTPFAVKPPIPHSQNRISSVTAAPPKLKTALWGSSGAEDIAGPVGATVPAANPSRLSRHSRSEELPRPGRHLETSPVVSNLVSNHHPQSTHESFASKHKRVSESLPVLNGDRGVKGTNIDQPSHPPSKSNRKGSFRGGWSEDGRGGGVKHEPSKFKGGGIGNPKPWRGESF